MAATPEQNGTVTAAGAAAVQNYLTGLRNSKGQQVYLPYQPGSASSDATTAYNSATGEWEISQSGLGAEWVERFLNLHNASLIPSEEFATFTSDTLADYMLKGLHRYAGVLQTTWPDLAPWRDAGNKILHFHGESDDSIPTASSVRYWDSVREFLYPELSYNRSAEAMGEFYQFYSVPGAAHCSTNPNEPNAGFPQRNLEVMIRWVEEGVVPERLGAKVLLEGEFEGEEGEICMWPLRPFWRDGEGEMECVYDQESLDTWRYELDFTQFKIY
jgi:tannase